MGTNHQNMDKLKDKKTSNTMQKSTSSSPKKPLVTIKWPKGDPSVLATGYDPNYKYPRVSWSESDIKYPLKWLMNQHQSNKSNKLKKEDKKKKKKKIKRQLKSINHSKSKKHKLSSKHNCNQTKHTKITLQPMDENMDNEYRQST